MSIQPQEGLPKRSAESLTQGRQFTDAIKALIAGGNHISWGGGEAWRDDESIAIPDHTREPIKLLCYELLPYALMRNGKMNEKQFRDHLSKAKKADTRSEYWANLYGERTIRETIENLIDGAPESLRKLALQPGDIIILTSQYGVHEHTAIVSESTSAGTPKVYSLDGDLSETPSELPLGEMLAAWTRSHHLEVWAPK
jgi:hypothetical protein